MGLLPLLLLAAQSIVVPVAESESQLFIIERSTNANVVHYDARLTKEGTLDPQEPVIVYWTMGSPTGRREQLNALERGRVYGFSISKDSSADFYRMYLASQPHQGDPNFCDRRNSTR
jgi:hypothetical protein